LDQVTAVTRATKEIEAKISGDLWDRQKRWEMRRDAIFEGAKRFAAAQISLVNLSGEYGPTRDLDPKERLKAALTDWERASENLHGSRIAIGFVCSKQVESAFQSAHKELIEVAAIFYRENDDESAEAAKKLPQLVAKTTDTITSAVRQELQIDSVTSEIGVPA
jgi:hypothetical protein